MVRSVLLIFTRNGFTIKAVARDTNPIASQLLWCERQDLNLHAFRHGVLSAAWLPLHHARIWYTQRESNPYLHLERVPTLPFSRWAHINAALTDGS